MTGRSLGALALSALALAATGCDTTQRPFDDVVAIDVRGPDQTEVGRPENLTIFVDLFLVEPATPDGRRVLLGLPVLYTWTIDPAEGASISPEGVFTAAAPGEYRVRATGLGVSDVHAVSVAPSRVAMCAGTYTGTFKATATQRKTGKTAAYEVPLTLDVATDGTVTARAHFEGRTAAGRVYLDASATGAVDEDCDVVASGTMSVGPSKAKAKSGPFEVTGFLNAGKIHGMVRLADGTTAAIEGPATSACARCGIDKGRWTCVGTDAARLARVQILDRPGTADPARI